MKQTYREAAILLYAPCTGLPSAEDDLSLADQMFCIYGEQARGHAQSLIALR
jgi:hypothetical protein